MVALLHPTRQSLPARQAALQCDILDRIGRFTDRNQNENRSLAMNKIVLSLALVVSSVGFAALGCGTDTTGGSTTGSANGGYVPPASIPLENASLEYSKALCYKFFNCCDSTELADIFSKVMPQPATAAECATALQPLFEKEPFAYLAQVVKDGKIAYDPVVASACFAGIADDCENNSEFFIEKVPACKNFVTGLVPDGGDCLEGQCANPSSYCVGGSAGGSGTCGPIPKENDPCPDFVCPSGLQCIQDAGGTGTCQKPLADGSMCNFTGGGCASEYCDVTAQMCTAKKANGEACVDFDACKDGFCDMTTMKCTAKKADGESCMSYDECISDNCTEANKCAPPQCNGK
jgi:hypothetical protein